MITFHFCGTCIVMLLSSTVMFRTIFVFQTPCNPISSLSNQSRPNSGCVSLFSVIRIGSITFLFSILTSINASPLSLIGFLLTSTNYFFVFVSFFRLIIGGIMVIGDPVSIMNSIGCPSTNRIAL